MNQCHQSDSMGHSLIFLTIQETAKLPVTASCCDSAACRLCAVQYLARLSSMLRLPYSEAYFRTRRCWAVDCGTPTAVTDLVILEVDHHSLSAVYLFFSTSSLSSSSLPSLTKSSKSTSVPIKYSLFFDWHLHWPHCCHCHPQFHHYCLHCHLIKSLKPDLASPLHCQLCASLCRRAVTSPCCGGSACR